MQQPEELRRLAIYFLHAKLMHDHLNLIYDESGTLEEISKRGLYQDFECLLAIWLSALYVVVEGYIELGLSDDEIDRLIAIHGHSLRRFRNGTFHFQKRPDKHLQFFESSEDRLNWAHELHAHFKRLFLEKFTWCETESTDVPED